MKILISNAVWGRSYCSIFARYSVATLLAEGNLPALARRASIIFHVVTTKHDREWLVNEPAIVELAKYCAVEWELMQDFGIGKPTAGGGKYQLLTALQNIGIARAAIDQDAIVFNYADFIWSDGSLPASVDLLSQDGERIDAVLGFCLPVDRDAALPEIDRARREGTVGVVELAPHEGARIAIKNIHREAKIRFWDGPEFTIFPTYLIWPAEDYGILVRAYHQSILALRVSPKDPNFARGIRHGTLDGSFTAQLAEDETKTFSFATDSDRVLIFSLYETRLDSRLPRGETRESSLIKLLKRHVPPEQRRFADHPIYVRTKAGGEDVWERISTTSQQVLDHAQEEAFFDREENIRIRKKEGSIPTLVKLAFPYKHIVWRLDYVYKQLIVAPGRVLMYIARRMKRMIFAPRTSSL